jgi:hypothetical protein
MKHGYSKSLVLPARIHIVDYLSNRIYERRNKAKTTLSGHVAMVVTRNFGGAAGLLLAVGCQDTSTVLPPPSVAQPMAHHTARPRGGKKK